jgi:hypothetical protein
MNCRRIIHIASFYAIQKCTCQTLQQQQSNLLVLKNYDAPAGNQTRVCTVVSMYLLNISQL